MYISDYLRFSVKGMLSKKSRFFLTVLSILIGIISIIVISAIGSSGQYAINDELDNLGLNGSSIKSKSYNLTLEDAESVKTYLGSDFMISSMSKEIATGNYNNKKYNLFLWGGEEDALDILNMKIIYGRGIRKNDITENKNIAVITKNSAEKIFGKVNCVGEEISIYTPIKQNNFTVVGVADNSNIYDMISENIPPFFYIPSSVFLDMYNLENVAEISVMSTDAADVDSASDKAISYLEDKKYTTDMLYYENLNAYKKSISNVTGIVALIITLIGGVSLIVGGISVMNTMLISVNERKKEIGIKKAIGSTNFSIMLEFLIESLIIVMISCILGIGIGLIISYLLINIYGITFVINLKTICIAVLFSVLIGALFGVYPAYKASKLNPVESLKS